MRKISPKGQRWLKCFHVFFCCAWVGGAISLLSINLFLQAEEGMDLYGIDSSMKFIDDFIIITGAIGCFLTGTLYSVFTNWGWFKHRWITVKWIITLWGIISGTFFLGPWLNSLPPLSKAEGMNALMNQSYINTKHILWYLGGFQVATIILAVFISVLKPWRKKSSE
ncbi:MAG: hypothetical protein KA369_11135 [Spirochaetes bacterium]|nr:hypothetical protein [Spirochaetota bacterium]